MVFKIVDPESQGLEPFRCPRLDCPTRSANVSLLFHMGFSKVAKYRLQPPGFDLATIL